VALSEDRVVILAEAIMFSSQIVRLAQIVSGETLVAVRATSTRSILAVDSEVPRVLVAAGLVADFIAVAFTGVGFTEAAFTEAAVIIASLGVSSLLFQG